MAVTLAVYALATSEGTAGIAIDKWLLVVSALLMAAGPIMSALSGVPAGYMTDRFGANRVVIAALIQVIGGLLCLAFLPQLWGVGGYVAALLVLTPGFQVFLAANNTAVMTNAAEDQRVRLSGLLGLSRNLGLMTGAAAMFAACLDRERSLKLPPTKSPAHFR